MLYCHIGNQEIGQNGLQRLLTISGVLWGVVCELRALHWQILDGYMVSSKNLCSYPGSGIVRIDFAYTANISTVLSTAFGSVKCATVILLHRLQP